MMRTNALVISIFLISVDARQNAWERDTLVSFDIKKANL